MQTVITRIWRHLQLASVPPPIAPARGRQAFSVFDEVDAPWRRPIDDVRADPVHSHVPSALPCLPPGAGPRPAPPEHPGDAPEPIQRASLQAQAAGPRGAAESRRWGRWRGAPADTGAKRPFDLPIRSNDGCGLTLARPLG